jgi:uncharacterized membrane protein
MSMPASLPMTKKRYPLLDYIRGVAIVLMIIFHGSYDLNLFGFIEVDFYKDNFWYVFPRVIVALFMFSVGCGLTLAHKNHIKWNPFWKRFLKLVACAIAITISTYYMFPQSWVYFGTLHSIAVCSLIVLPFLKYPRVSLVVALILIIPHLILGYSIPWPLLNHNSMDYISPFPWVGVVLLGVFATHQGWIKIEFKDNAILKALEFLGIHSLVIYMIHQPFLYALAWLLYKFTS